MVELRATGENSVSGILFTLIRSRMHLSCETRGSTLRHEAALLARTTQE